MDRAMEAMLRKRGLGHELNLIDLVAVNVSSRHIVLHYLICADCGRRLLACEAAGPTPEAAGATG